jgi:hypothetical protein
VTRLRKGKFQPYQTHICIVLLHKILGGNNIAATRDETLQAAKESAKLFVVTLALEGQENMAVILPTEMNDMGSVIFFPLAIVHPVPEPKPDLFLPRSCKSATCGLGLNVPPSAGTGTIALLQLLFPETGRIYVAAIDRISVSPGLKCSPIGHKAISTGTISPGFESCLRLWVR